MFLHRLKMAYQFYKFGYADSEFYSLDHTIASKIHQGAKRQLDSGATYPVDIGFDRWTVILQRLIYLSNQYLKEETQTMSNADYDEFFYLLKTHFRNLWE